METEKILKTLNELTGLLKDDLSPHRVSYLFEKITSLINEENLRFENSDCKEYYDDRELSLILIMKNEALANGQFEQATKFRFIEVKLLVEKGNNEFTKLKIERSFFEYKNDSIIFHFNKRKENQRLIANLIDRYNLAHEPLISTNLPSACNYAAKQGNV